MDESRISLTIVPSGGDEGSVLVSDFLKQVDALKKLVGYASRTNTVEARIVGLSMNSPASVEIEAFNASNNAAVPVGAFFHDVYNVVEKAATPINLEREVFDTIKDFASVVGKGVNSTIIVAAGNEVKFDIIAKDRIDGIFGQDYSRHGTADGMLEAVNIHGKINNCALYPLVGPKRISCRFEEHLFKKIKPALGKYVMIEGILKYRWREKFPHAADIHKIDVLPSWDEQPSFEDILGMASNATHGEASEEFVKARRYGW